MKSLALALILIAAPAMAQEHCVTVDDVVAQAAGSLPLLADYGGEEARLFREAAEAPEAEEILIVPHSESDVLVLGFGDPCMTWHGIIDRGDFRRFDEFVRGVQG